MHNAYYRDKILEFLIYEQVLQRPCPLKREIKSTWSFLIGANGAKSSSEQNKWNDVHMADGQMIKNSDTEKYLQKDQGFLNRLPGARRKASMYSPWFLSTRSPSRRRFPGDLPPLLGKRDAFLQDTTSPPPMFTLEFQ